jgi:hypothetical protein
MKGQNMTETLTADDVLGVLRKRFGSLPYFDRMMTRIIEETTRRDPSYWLVRVSPAQAAAVLGYSEATLRTWRGKPGKGPQCWWKEGNEQQSPVWYESRLALMEWDFAQREVKGVAA